MDALDACSERRSSTFRRSTNGAMTPNHAPIPQTVARPRVDPRIPDVKTRPRYAADIVAFLTSHQYNGAVDIKMLLTPTTAQFISIFKFLVCQVDPGYEFRGRNIADEVPPALKMAGYPFPESITKSHLQSIGSSNGWPNMLAMLHWFVIVIDVSPLRACSPVLY
jgi:kinetochore protein NDC80